MRLLDFDGKITPMDWIKRRAKGYKADTPLSVLLDDYHKESKELADRIVERNEYLKWFSDAVLSAIPGVTEEHLRQYVNYAAHPIYPEVTVRHPKLEWHLKLIDFSQYCKDQYGEYAENIAIHIWINKKYVITPEQCDEICKRGRKFGRCPKGKYLVKFYLDDIGDSFFMFECERFSKVDKANDAAIMRKAIAILLNENKDQIKRRYYSWD